MVVWLNECGWCDNNNEYQYFTCTYLDFFNRNEKNLWKEGWMRSWVSFSCPPLHTFFIHYYLIRSDSNTTFVDSCKNCWRLVYLAGAVLIMEIIGSSLGIIIWWDDVFHTTLCCCGMKNDWMEGAPYASQVSFCFYFWL